LRRYGAGRQMEYASTDPDEIATAIVDEIDQKLDCAPVATDGAARAAALLADLV
jgi:hypothetical protein